MHCTTAKTKYRKHSESANPIKADQTVHLLVNSRHHASHNAQLSRSKWRPLVITYVNIAHTCW